MGRLFAPKEPAKPAEPEKVASPPASLSRDDVKTIVSESIAGVAGQLSGVVAQLSEKLDAALTRQPQVVVQNPTPTGTVRTEPDITDSEINDAILSGQGAAGRIRALVDRQVTAAAEKILKERVAPLETFGATAIGDLTRRVTLETRPHYQKYKKEIDERINALDPQARARADVIDVIYNAVVGSHADDLAREAEEAAIRKMQENGGQPTKTTSTQPGSGAGRGAETRKTEVPTASDLGGKEGLEALAHKGGDPDAFARGMGYKDWNTYIKQFEELQVANA